MKILKINYNDLRNFRLGDFRINPFLEVFFGKEQIGEIKIISNNHPEGDDEIACFLFGGIGFQHHPVNDPGIACQIIYDEFYSNKSRR